MSYLKQGLRMLAVTIALMLPLSAAQALEAFAESGTIAVFKNNGFSVQERDQRYRIHPTATLGSKDPTRQQITDLKKGDEIAFTGEIVGDYYYVNYIQVLVDEPDEDDEVPDDE